MEKEKAPLCAVDFPEFTPPTYAEWKEEAIASLKGAPFDKRLLTKTYEGITLEPLYTAEHAAAFGAKGGLPGAEGYLRGTSAAGYNAQPWLIAQKGDAARPKEANAQLREGLSKGAVAICFDPRNHPELSCLHDFKVLLDGIDVVKYPLQAYCGASAAPTLGLLIAYAEQAGVDPAALSGLIGADPLGTLTRKGELCASMESYYDQMALCLRRAAAKMPQIKTIFIQGAVYHEGGASAVDELAAMFAAAVAYLDALGERGYSVDEIASQMAFSFPLGANFFMEIAKLRAARLIWAQIIAAYGGSQEAAKLDARAVTSHFTATAYDPYVNILRATTQAFSGVVGGMDALTIEPFDAAIRGSDEQSRRIARNIQVMMQNEFHLTAPVDPAGGSWFVETLTGQLAQAAWGKLQAIEAEGGLLAALKSGSLQTAIAATLGERFKKLASRADKAVGSNVYSNVLETRLKTEAGGQKTEDGKEICEVPSPPATPAEGVEYCFNTVAAAFKNGASVTQVKLALNQGESDTVTAIKPHRWTEQFEALRDRTTALEAQLGKKFEVFLANMGPVAQHKARADFSAGFMEVGGFTVLRNNGFADVASAAEAAIASQAQVTVICSTDDTYPQIVPELTAAIKAKAPQMQVILAGMPAPEYKDSYVAAGLDDSIHIKADCLSVLSKIQQAGGDNNEQ
jgi:methylmalonyl-CoA mutase